MSAKPSHETEAFAARVFDALDEQRIALIAELENLQSTGPDVPLLCAVELGAFLSDRLRNDVQAGIQSGRIENVIGDLRLCRANYGDVLLLEGDSNLSRLLSGYFDAAWAIPSPLARAAASSDVDGLGLVGAHASFNMSECSWRSCVKSRLPKPRTPIAYLRASSRSWMW